MRTKGKVEVFTDEQKKKKIAKQFHHLETTVINVWRISFSSILIRIFSNTHKR